MKKRVCLILFLIFLVGSSSSDKVLSRGDSDIMNYEETCQYLQSIQLIENGKIPPLPKRMPRYDDEEPLGISFFRTSIAGEKLEKLTMLRTYFGRSEIRNVSFFKSDLSESNLCWNDFIRVDFSHSNLTDSDLRASIYIEVRFCNANLENVDLRHSSFENCDFSGANMKGVKLTRNIGEKLELTDFQKREINWQNDNGSEPDGG